MNPIAEKADLLVKLFREQSIGSEAKKVMQTLYCGDEQVGEVALSFDEVEGRIRSYTWEGFDVAWAIEDDLILLTVSEQGEE